MSFGKRTPRPAAPPPGAEAEGEQPQPLRYAPSMKVQDKGGGVDAGFIALAIGVVLAAGGGAFFAPGVLSMFGGAKAAVAAPAPAVKGLDRDAIKAKLAAEAFPDEAGQAFMIALKTHFPAEHDDLLGRLADISLAGGDRGAFAVELDDWTERFSKSQQNALVRTGAEGFDRINAATRDWIDLLETAAPGCTAAQLEAFAADKKALASALAYGSKGYNDLVKAARAGVDLAVAGKAAPPVDPTLQADDARALRMVLGPASDERLIASEFITRLGDGTHFNPLAARPDLNMCALARSGLKQLGMLPSKTKAKLVAAMEF